MKKNSPNKREKMLLLLLAVLGVSFLTFTYALKPLYDRMGALEDTLGDKQMEQIATQSRLLSEPTLRQGLEDAREALKNLQSRYPADRPNEAVDSMLTDLYRRNGLTSVSMSFAARRDQPDSVTAYTVVGVTMTLNGSYAALCRMIDEVEQTGHIRIGKISFAHTPEPSLTENGEPDGTEPQVQNISVYFEVTMLREPEPEEYTEEPEAQ